MKSSHRLTLWYHRRHRSVHILLVALPLILMLSAGYLGVRAMALRSADHLTVTITRLVDEPGGRAGSIVYRQTFGRTLASEVEHTLNDKVYVYSLTDSITGHLGGGQPGYPWRYHLAFTWRGLVVETVDVSAWGGAGRFIRSALGLSDLRVREPKEPSPYNGSIILQLYQNSDGAIPSPPPTH